MAEISRPFVASHGTSRQSKRGGEGSCLFEMLQELAFESALRVGECGVRIGLAATAWQLGQAQALLEYAGVVPRLPAPTPADGKTSERVVAVALDTGLGRRGSAIATVSLHRDGEAGLSLDQRHASALAEMRARGARLAEIEQLAFDTRVPIPSMIGPMVRALSSVVIDDWGSTDVVLACARRDAPAYCESLGFSRVPGSARTRDSEVLLHLPTSRLGHLLAPTLGSVRLPE